VALQGLSSLRDVERHSEWFSFICSSNGLQLSREQISLFEAYADLLLRWNRKVNLISRKDEKKVWSRHILASISFLFKHALSDKAQVLDLGTGGGLPGIPIKILCSSLSLTLADSIKKKTVAVENIIQDLGLKDITVVCGRAEELAQLPRFHNQFDYVVTRGVAGLGHLIKWSFPFLRVSEAKQGTGDQLGRTHIAPPALIALKGGDVEAEIKAAKQSSNVLDITVIELGLAGLEAELQVEKKAVVVRFK
jgi:16S rRNA (guanine527-N7)-methyltransferase